MQKNKLNNVIVLKDISSNIVEEAIVVLKSNIDLKQEEKKALSLSNEKIVGKNKCILKEAEFVIENCISQMQTRNKEKENEKNEKKYKMLKKITLALISLNILLILKLF